VRTNHQDSLFIVSHSRKTESMTGAARSRQCRERAGNRNASRALVVSI
jgi:hypothetical protein